MYLRDNSERYWRLPKDPDSPFKGWKRCRKCKVPKRRERDFPKHPLSADGYYSYCRDCQDQKQREWRAANPERVREQDERRWRRRDAQKRGNGVYEPHVTKAWLRARDGSCCYYCGVVLVFDGPSVPTSAHLEHKTPLVRGGEHSEDNCVLACRSCNLRKRDKTAEEFLGAGLASV